MAEERPFTIDSFFKYCSEGKLMAANCMTCKKLLIPPRGLCPDCLSSNLGWTQLKGTGELLTFTIVHVSSVAFQSQTPYAVGIVRLTEGATLSGMIREAAPDELKIGMSLKTKFEQVIAEPWQPQARYYFVPA